jgi:hypothetical protein
MNRVPFTTSPPYVWRNVPPPPPWVGEPFDPDPGFALVRIQVLNVNQILDDAWNLYVDGNYIGNFPGEPDSELNFYGQLPIGVQAHLTAIVTIDQSDNYFEVNVYSQDSLIETFAVFEEDPADSVVGYEFNVGYFTPLAP